MASPTFTKGDKCWVADEEECFILCTVKEVKNGKFSCDLSYRGLGLLKIQKGEERGGGRGGKAYCHRRPAHITTTTDSSHSFVGILSCFDDNYKAYNVPHAQAFPVNPSHMDGVRDNTELMYLQDPSLLHNIKVSSLAYPKWVYFNISFVQAAIFFLQVACRHYFFAVHALSTLFPS